MKYSQPVIVANMVEGVSQAFIKNQTKDLKIKVGAKPAKLIYPYCHQNISTIIEDKCSCSSFFLFSYDNNFSNIFYLYHMYKY